MITIDTVELKNNYILAPIAGFTDSPYRQIAKKHGAGLVVTELVSADGAIRNIKKTLNLMRFTEAERPIAIQLFGNKPDIMAEAAAFTESLGPDLIDLNLGCPAPKVCKSGEGSGSALLLKPEKIERIASAVVNSIKIPVTAKIRIGWDHDNLTYPDVVKALEHGGVRAIAVHGRTRAQKYSGFADWDIITEINHMTDLPVFGNGDITTVEEAENRLKESGCAAVMIGRGAIGNPWIFSKTTPTGEEVKKMILYHLSLMLDHYGEKAIFLMRKHLVKYIHGFRNAANIRKKLMQAMSQKEIEEIVIGSEFF